MKINEDRIKKAIQTRQKTYFERIKQAMEARQKAKEEMRKKFEE